MITVKVKKLGSDVVVPRYMTEGASGCDVEAWLAESITLAPLGRAAVPTGLQFEIPEGWEIQVRPRSGLSFKQGLTVINAPGTIDSDYRGELKVLLVNLGETAVTIHSHDRIAQLVLQKVEQIAWQDADSLATSARAAAGFGSTGVSDARA